MSIYYNTTQIDCEINHCKHNKDGFCQEKAILISGYDMTGEETGIPQCKSFISERGEKLDDQI